MRICILATAENVEAVRDSAAESLTHFRRDTILSTPLSPDGTGPATHWFCTFNVSKEMFDRIVALRNLSEMAEADPKEFLKDRGLKVVKVR